MNWKVYASRYVLAKPVKAKHTVSAKEMRALRQKTANLSRRVAALEVQVAENRALKREMSRLRTELVYLERRPDDYYTYQAALLTLSMTSGAFDALIVTTRHYYPRYYVYFEPARSEVNFWEGYWAGYFDGYYDRGSWAWYNEDLDVPGHVVLFPTDNGAAYRETTYKSVIEIIERTTIMYNALPADDLSAVDVPPPPTDIEFAMEPMEVLNAEQDPAAPMAPAEATNPEPMEATEPTDLERVLPEGEADIEIVKPAPGSVPAIWPPVDEAEPQIDELAPETPEQDIESLSPEDQPGDLEDAPKSDGNGNSVE